MFHLQLMLIADAFSLAVNVPPVLLRPRGTAIKNGFSGKGLPVAIFMDRRLGINKAPSNGR